MRSNRSLKLESTSPEIGKAEKSINRTESFIKKASSFPVDRTLQMEMIAADPQQVAENPFLKARMQAFLRNVGSAASKEPQTPPVKDDLPDLEASLFREERVTFKKVRHSIIGSSKNIADEFSKKYLESNNSAKR